MRKFAVGYGFVALLLTAGCYGESIGALDGGEGNGNNPNTDAAYEGSDASNGYDAEARRDGALNVDGNANVDAEAQCCPIDPQPSGCMNLGGSNASNGACVRTCDFFCSENWRVVKDAAGCDVWVYDTRQPHLGEGPDCLPIDAGPGLDAAITSSDDASTINGADASVNSADASSHTNSADASSHTNSADASSHTNSADASSHTNGGSSADASSHP